MQNRSLSQTALPFRLESNYKPAGDQQRVIDTMCKSLLTGREEQTILGVTGSGKTFMMASITERLQRPTLVIAHNKTLAAQLAEEFKRFFPDNAVHYFVSYYDYYQPESYLPSSDTFIEKQTVINENIERLRNAATQSLLTRSDTLIVASVSCIYGLGNPEDYIDLSLVMNVGENYKMDKMTRRLADLQFSRNDFVSKRGTFTVKGQVVELMPASEEFIYRFSFWGETLESITRIDPLLKSELENIQSYIIYPANPFVTTADKIANAKENILNDMSVRIDNFQKREKYVEAQRIRERVSHDVEMLDTVGFVSGIENYSSYFDGRVTGEPPSTLLDYFPEDAIVFIDESHITLPQIGAMYYGDRSRKQTLVDYGFRLPSAMNNRPLKFNEFFPKIKQKVYVSATPAAFDRGIGTLPNMGGEVEKQLRMRANEIAEKITIEIELEE
jgi:excinuclease ABC subunit B